MHLTDDQFEWIYDRTNGRCHLCHGTLAWSNYGLHGRRGAWEIDHDRARALGGSDHLTNLWPAHTRCNRSKGVLPTVVVRAANGFDRPPRSAADGRRIGRAILGGIIGAFVADAKRLPLRDAVVAGAVIGAATVTDEPPA